MITTRTARQCGQADYGWLQARYTFSFGHYFDPKLLGYASLRVLNQEVLAPGAAFQPRTYPKVDILNVILDGEAEYRDSEGNHVQASAGEALLLSTQPVSVLSNLIASRHSLSLIPARPAGVEASAMTPLFDAISIISRSIFCRAYYFFPSRIKAICGLRFCRRVIRIKK